MKSITEIGRFSLVKITENEEDTLFDYFNLTGSENKFTLGEYISIEVDTLTSENKIIGIVLDNGLKTRESLLLVDSKELKKYKEYIK